jgi:release factor glutamine methyltransferase
VASRRDRPHGFQDALKITREILSSSRELIAKGSIDTEAEQLVMAAYRMATGKSLTRLELFTRISDRYPDQAGDKLLVLAGSRAEGKPLQHLTGVQVFLDHEYEVGPDVLVPRPETEVLVQYALSGLRSLKRPLALGLEIGLGSGAISVELLAAFPSLRMLGSELTDLAASRAERNASRILGKSAGPRFKVVRALSPLEVWEPFERVLTGEERADFVISNPPYLSTSDPIEAEVLRHEPATALFAPESDLIHFYRVVALRAERFLKPGGFAFMELAPERAQEIQFVFAAAGWNVQIFPDLAERERVLVASLIGNG